IRDVAVEHDLLLLTDEIYEYILHDGREHVSPGSIEGLGDRTVTISGLSKTYSVTGWRLAYAVAPEAIAGAIRKTHDFLTVGAPHPLQEAGAEALRMPASYYEKLREDYGRRRAALLGVLREAGLLCFEPEGAYYVMTDVRSLLPEASREELASFAFRLVDEIGLAGVPGTSFYRNRADGAPYLRFTFSKKDATLEGARARLARLKR
ncbi:MAG: aminotransferase class I/II-fold pyridoxal phosphate-dependent enzyme, partial [Candidatus Methylomirabilis sp.]|nr:aminotransferase class I/II-fold pyridoxal phosphate-dependent enzyme [Deltaproteobacteria bacterium]